MRFIIILFIFILIISGGGLLFSFAPFHFYQVAIDQGISGEILTLGADNGQYLNTKSLVLENRKDKEYEQIIWKDFHFSNFIVPFPIEHPIVSILPIIKKQGKRIHLGAKYINRKSKELMSFKILKIEKFNKYNIYQKLFRLPFFKNKLRNISAKQIWKDLFNKNIGREFEYVYSFNQFYSMVYNLYILNLRKKMFPKNMTSFSFIAESQLGVIRVDFDEDDDRIKEILYLNMNGLFYTTELISLKHQDTAKGLRQRFLSAYNYKESTLSSSKELYSRFKLLPYEKRIETSGIVYLFAGFSHIPTKEEYLKQMIQFLERGRGNIFFLNPLYQYSYKVFGSNFSGKDEQRLENASRNLERKIEEELQDELKEAMTDDIAHSNSEFSSPTQRKNYYLRKAKNDTLEDENMLTEN